MHKKYFHARVLSAILAFSMIASAAPLNTTKVVAADNTPAITAVDESNKEGAYKVTYDYATNGGTSVDVTYGMYDKNDKVNLKPVAVKDGWTFVGWNTDKNATKGLTDLSVVDKDITLYAIYKCDVDVTIHAVADVKTGDETKVSQTFTFYNKISSQDIDISKLISATPTIDGWKIAGFTVAPITDKNAVVYSSDDIVGFVGLTKTSKVSLTPGPAVEMYVVYTASPEITYSVDGKETKKDTSDVFYIAHAKCDVKADDKSEDVKDKDVKPDTLPDVNIMNAKASFIMPEGTEKDGYVFKGWTDGSDKVYAAGDTYAEKSVSEIMKTPLVMTSVYEEQQPMDIDMSMATARAIVGQPLKLKATVVPENALNKTIVWSSSNEKIATVNEKGIVTPLAPGKVDIVATVKGTKVSNYTKLTVVEKQTEKFGVTYDTTTNGGSRDGSSTVELAKGSKADLSVKATKDGYTFVGWNTDKNATKALKKVVVNSDTTLYAIFKKDVTLKIVSNGKPVTEKVTFYNKSKSQKVTLPKKINGGVYEITALTREKKYDKNKLVGLGSEFTMTPEDTTLYAVYSIDIKAVYKAPTKIDGNTPSAYKNLREIDDVMHFVGNEKISFDHVIPSDIEAPTIDGYKFLGWAVTSESKAPTTINNQATSTKAADTKKSEQKASVQETQTAASASTSSEPWTNMQVDCPSKIVNIAGDNYGYMKYRGYQATTENAPDGYYTITFDMECDNNPKSLKTFSVAVGLFDANGNLIVPLQSLQFSDNNTLKVGTTYKSNEMHIPDNTATIKFYAEKQDDSGSTSGGSTTAPVVKKPTVDYNKLYKAGETINSSSQEITVEAVYESDQAQSGDVLTISPENPTLNVGDKKKMNITVMRNKTNVVGDYTVKFIVADSKVATIDENGILEAKSKGKTTLTVEAVAKDGSKLTKNTTINVTDTEGDKSHPNLQTGVDSTPWYGGLALMATGLIGGLASFFGFRRKKK